ncbi:glycosyltransferase [Candidatus Uhrbacteria bacterium]|nr:glycosyltransferase [Candidatus Uhrbacteria bacterium]MBD3284126.1 glycosyltransferase [Candidatus Uhrbacteria bacterium]
MLIGIDASRANKEQKTGVEWYAYHLIQELKKLTINDGNQWILYTREPLKEDLATLPENWFEVRAKWPPKRLWTQVRMSWEMWRRPCDVLFVPAHVLPPIRPDNSVVTVHDVGFKRMPHLYKQADKSYHDHTTRRIVRTSARIVTVSEFSAKELVALYGAKPENIAITHLGIDHNRYRQQEQAGVDEVLLKYHIPKPYFFFISRLEAKKNLVNLIKAFDAFKVHRGLGDPTQLVLAGKPGYQYSEIKAQINASKYQDQILELGYVPEEDVPLLMAGATGYLNLAWYEGFGIPPIQAMACGTPVIVADNSSMPEVVGQGNGLFVPPDGIDATARAMERFVSDPGLVADLQTKGLQRVKQFTWEMTAKQTLPVLTKWLGA